jgi:uncharacterized protein (TIGR03000 family)
VPAQSAAPESPAAAEPAPVLPEPASVLPDAKPAPAVPDMPPILPPPPKDAMNRAMGGNGLLSVVVPEDARVYVNGMLTQTPGTYRQYVSRGLVPGYSYTYEVRVVLNRDGKVVSDSKTVQLRAGQTRDVSFDLQRSSPEMDPGMQLTASTLSR